MGPVSLGLDLVASAFPGGTYDNTGFLLWTAGANYLTINAAGDKIFINLQ